MSLGLDPIQAANRGQVRKNIPPIDEVTKRVDGCLGGIFKNDVVTLIARYTMDRFNEAIFDATHWRMLFGMSPVTLPPIEDLHAEVRKLSSSTGKKPGKEIEKMSPVECVDFLGNTDLAKREDPSIPEDLYVCLNTRVRPEDTRVAGLTCVVTFIPQYLLLPEKNKVVEVTARTLGTTLTDPKSRPVAKFYNPRDILDRTLALQDADGSEPSHYFVMERAVRLDTIAEKPTDLMARVAKQGDGWQLPEPRNFIATVFARYAWIYQREREFLYGRLPFPTYALCQGKHKTVAEVFLYFGNFGTGIFEDEPHENGLHASYSVDIGRPGHGLGMAKKFGNKRKA